MNDWCYMKILRLSKNSPPDDDEDIWSFGLFIVGAVVTFFVMNKILSDDMNSGVRYALIGLTAIMGGYLLAYLQVIIRALVSFIGFSFMLLEFLVGLAFVCVFIYLACEFIYIIAIS